MLIKLIPIEYDDAELFEKLSTKLSDLFQVSVDIEHLPIILKDGWSIEREQLHSSWLLLQLKSYLTNEHSKILGLTKLDLYIPILTYLFGEAELSGQAAVVSSFRFHNELYGLPPNRNLTRRRIIKESIHELGHTFGLKHCLKFDCVMHPSTYIEEFDFKTDSFCVDCVSKLLELRNKTS